MKITLMQSYYFRDREYRPGESVDMADDLALELVKKRVARMGAADVLRLLRGQRLCTAPMATSDMVVRRGRP